jgi:hypothetical protein
MPSILDFPLALIIVSQIMNFGKRLVLFAGTLMTGLTGLLLANRALGVTIFHS